MNTATLAARIGSLTHVADRLEQFASILEGFHPQADTCALRREVAIVHDLLDQLNADYAEALDREQDHAFEASTH